MPHKCDLFSDEELFRLNASVQIIKRFFKNLERSFTASEAYNELVEAAHCVKNDNPYARAEELEDSVIWMILLRDTESIRNDGRKHPRAGKWYQW